MEKIKLFLLIPKFLMGIASIKKSLRNGRKRFKRALVENEIPQNLALELSDSYYYLDELLSIEQLASMRTATGKHTVKKQKKTTE